MKTSRLNEQKSFLDAALSPCSRTASFLLFTLFELVEIRVSHEQAGTSGQV